MIKIIFLVVSIIAVPIGYYFWMGGWGPISEPLPEMMSFASSKFTTPLKSPTQEEMIIGRDDGPGAKDDMSSDRVKSSSRFSMPPPKSSSQTTVAQDDGPMSTKGDMPSDRVKSPSRFSMSPPKSSQEGTTTALNNEPRGMSSDRPKLQQAEKSFAGETVARLEPGVPGAQSPSPSAAVRALDTKEIKLLMEQGERFIATGDVVAARIAFQRAAEAGDANAAVAVGATYDPSALAKLGAVGIGADVAKARSWYQKAEKLGSPDAKRRLEVLADR
jgi:hypothetical protein